MRAQAIDPPENVLMIHGAGGGGWEWQVWSRVFAAAGWRVHAPDLAPAAEGLAATRLGHYLEQVRGWQQALRPRLLIGASLGGLLARHACDRDVALVLVNPMPAEPRHGAPLPSIVPWQRTASLASTARALGDSEASTWQCAWRRWRDESGAALDDAGRVGEPTHGPRRCLVIVSGRDDDVPAATSRMLARQLGADLLELPQASHVGPLLGRDAGHVAERVLAWWQLTS
jgi:pimeloyl-ACP methyl ester carboxylesterase